MTILKKAISRKLPVVVLVNSEDFLTKNEVLNKVLFEQSDLGYSVFYQSNLDQKEKFIMSLANEIELASSVLANNNACLVIVKFQDPVISEINFLKKERDSVFSSATAECAKSSLPFNQQFFEHIEWDNIVEKKVRLVELVFQKEMLSIPDNMFKGRNAVQGGLQTIVYGISGILNTAYA